MKNCNLCLLQSIMYYTNVLLHMNRQVQYSMMIASIATILISGTMYLAEAKTFDKEAGYSISGMGIDINIKGTPSIDLTIVPIEGKNMVRVTYHVLHGDSSIQDSHGRCLGDEKVMKVASNQKASVILNTLDLFDCSSNTSGPDGIFMADIIGTGLSTTNNKFDDGDCTPDVNGGELCWRERGSKTVFSGIGTISGFDMVFENIDADIEKSKLKYTEWTNP